MGTWIIGGIVLLAVAAAIIKIYKDKKNHKSSCGCSTGKGCGGCSGCH